MGSNDINATEQILKLAEKYGLTVVLMLIFGSVLYSVFRALRKGELVPREYLDRVEEDRDRLQIMMEKEREGFMAPLLEVVNNLKKDNSDGRGG